MSVRERAVLVLEDGTSFAGRAVGALGEAGGEVVFTTAMTGYQEVLTDPSFRGHLVVMTYPLVGNYGANEEDVESATPHVRALIVREICDEPSNWRAQESLGSYLKKHRIVAVAGIDTRALTRHLRERGPTRGILATGDVDKAALVDEARRLPDLSDQDLVGEVSIPNPYVYATGSGPRIAVIDCGARRSILRSLADRGCHITVVPASTTADEILAMSPDGVVISSGPGDPAVALHLVESVGKIARL